VGLLLRVVGVVGLHPRPPLLLALRGVAQKAHGAPGAWERTGVSQTRPRCPPVLAQVAVAVLPLLLLLLAPFGGGRGSAQPSHLLPAALAGIWGWPWHAHADEKWSSPPPRHPTPLLLLVLLPVVVAVVPPLLLLLLAPFGGGRGSAQSSHLLPAALAGIWGWPWHGHVGGRWSSPPPRHQTPLLLLVLRLLPRLPSCFGAAWPSSATSCGD
jgi:hypothetical protein